MIVFAVVLFQLLSLYVSLCVSPFFLSLFSLLGVVSLVDNPHPNHTHTHTHSPKPPKHTHTHPLD